MMEESTSRGRVTRVTLEGDELPLVIGVYVALWVKAHWCSLVGSVAVLVGLVEPRHT